MGFLSTVANYSAIVRPIQWLVIVLIWLFFLRVVRAVWVEVRPAGPRQQRSVQRKERREGTRGSRRRPLHLEVLEPPERQGRIFEFDGELTIGRAPECGIQTSYDTYSSSTHARVFRHEDQLWVEDLSSTNGTFVNSERISRATRLAKGDLLQVGATVFEVRR